MAKALLPLALVCVWLSAAAFTLQWNPNAETDLTTYRLYRKSEPCSSMNTPAYVKDVGLATGTQDTPEAPAVTTTYCWGVTAMNLAGQESGLSNLVEKTWDVAPPPPPPPPTPIVCLKYNPKGKCLKWGNS